MTVSFLRRACASLALLMGAALTAEAQAVKVIVNAGYAGPDLSAAEVAKLFLRQATTFSDGSPAKPVDQPASAAVRAEFSKSVLGRPVNAIETYWQQQIFSGKDAPPPVKAGDDAVVAWVKATPGAIGYVSGDAAVSGVRVLSAR